MIQDHQLTLKSSAIGSFVYFASTILRDVLSAKTVGLIHDNRNLKQWFEKNGFRTTFEFSNSQLQKSDLTFDSKLVADCIIAFNPFEDFNLEQIEKSLELFKRFDVALIIGAQTLESNFSMPKALFSRAGWVEILSDYGKVVEIYRHDNYNLFMVTK